MKKKTFYGIMLLLVLIILGAALIPTVGTPGISSDRATTRTQYVGYVNALQLFNGEYGHWPQFFEGESEFDLSKHPNSERFMETLSGLDKDGEVVKAYGNTRALRFYEFTESEFEISKATGDLQIVGRLGNHRIILSIDHDENGIITVPDGKETKQIRARATAYSTDSNGEVVIALWD